MEATQPASLIFVTGDNDPKFALHDTLITLEIRTEHHLPVNSQLEIGVPRELYLSEETELACWISTWPDSDRPCTFDEETYTFTIPNINKNILRGGIPIEIELKGFLNSEFAAATGSFSILTKTAEGYMIDAYTGELAIASNCDYPCLQCSHDDSSMCRKCNTEPNSPDQGTQFHLYFENTCISECPSNYFPLNNICS